MTTPETIHQVLAQYEDFEELVEKMDAEKVGEEIRETIKSHGNWTASFYEYEGEEFNIYELGWIRLAWEAYHQ